MTDTKLSALDATNTRALRDKALTPKGALVGLTADLTTINASSGYNIPFNAESYDTDGIHDNVTNNTRLTVPSGYSWVRVGMKAFVTNVTTDEGAALYVRQFNSAGTLQSFRGLPAFSFGNNDYTEFAMSGMSSPIQVNAGDYFVFQLWSNDTSVTVLASHTSAWMELLA